MDVSLKQFSGPLDLLLSLIEQQELRITDIALSEVTEQYLVYLDTLEEQRAEELADFLVVAAKLLYLKSRRLLPEFFPEEEDEDVGDLEAQLTRYKQFVDASRSINGLWMGSAHSFFRKEPPRAPTTFSLPPGLSVETLEQSMLHLVSKLAPPKRLPETHIDKGISLKERIDRIRTLLSKKKSFRFVEALDTVENKTDIIIGFLAILELVKQQTLFLEQSHAFGDILITRAS